MPCLPGYEPTGLDVSEDYSQAGKTIDKPNAYNRFPRYNHKTVPTTLTLSHPDRPDANPSVDQANTQRYKNTPPTLSPFEQRDQVQLRGIKKGYSTGDVKFKVTEASEAPKPVLSRKMVPKEEKVAAVHGGKKSIKDSNERSTNTVPNPDQLQEAITHSQRYQNSRRFENQSNVVEYHPEPVKSKELGKDQRYKHTKVNQSLVGVFTPTRDNCEDRSASVKPVPWATE